MSSDVIHLHICIFMHFFVLVTDCSHLLHHRGWATQLTSVAAEPTQFSGLTNSPAVFTIQWLEGTWPPRCFKLRHSFATLSSQTLLSEDRQCCESWRDAELGARAVCAVRDRLETRGENGSESPRDMTGKDLVLVRWVVLLCFSPHCDAAVSCLTKNMLTTSSSSSDCYVDWHPASLTIHHLAYNASSPFSSWSSTMPIPRRGCCFAPAARC